MGTVIPMGSFHKERENFLIGFIGDVKTGKSATMRKIAIAWRKAKPSYYNIIAFDPQRRFTDLADYFIGAGDDKWAHRLQKFRNCLIILDDYRVINKNPIPISGLEYLISQRSDLNLDIMYACHNPGLVINYLTYFTDRYYIFYTNSTEGQFEKKIPNYSLCVAASRKVNEHVFNFGRGKYPDFPHCIVVVEERKVKAIHMSRNITDIKIKPDGRNRL